MATKKNVVEAVRDQAGKRGGGLIIISGTPAKKKPLSSANTGQVKK